jgi:Replication initiator protein A
MGVPKNKTKKKLGHSETIITRVEPSTLEFPIFSPTPEIYEDRVYERVKEVGSESITQRVTVGCSMRGTLSVFDQVVLFALTYIWERDGREENSVKTSLHELGKLTGIGWGKKQYDLLRASLNRLFEINVDFENVLVDKKKGKKFESQDRFRFVNRLNLHTHTNVKNKRIQGAGSEIEINALILNNLRENHARPVLLNVLVGLPSNHVRSAYLFFDRMTCNPSKTYTTTATNLLESLGIQSDRYKKPALRREFIRFLVDTLQEVAVWRGWFKLKMEPTKNGNDVKVTVTCIDKPADELEPSNLPLTHMQETLMEEFSEVELVSAAEFAKLILQQFQLDRSPSQQELKSLEPEISKHQITLESAEWIAKFFARDAKETNFKPRSVNAVKPYIERALTKFLKSKDTGLNPSSSFLPLNENGLRPEDLIWIAEELWSLKTPDAQRELIENKEEEIRKHPEKYKHFSNYDESTRSSMVLRLVIDDIAETDAKLHAQAI